MALIVHVILSVLFGVSLAILVVEKGDDWPISHIKRFLSIILGFFNKKLLGVLECTVCFSFWATLIGEFALKYLITGLFLWPFTGIIALGFTWFIIEFLNAIDNSNRGNKPNDKSD